MKKLILLSTFFFVIIGVKAQTLNPVSWTFTALKSGDKVYEIHLTANIEPGWHLYSQTQPNDAIAIPTGIKFNKNPLIILDGKVKEIGKLEKFKDVRLNISANQYSEKVDFVQVMKLRGNAKTNLSGGVEFQTCDDKKCLPPKTVNFSIAIK